MKIRGYIFAIMASMLSLAGVAGAADKEIRPE